MSNPIILYDNRFEDGDLSATNTATGYDVNNIKDLRTHTFWKANAAGTLYITEAPLASGSVTLANMRLSLVDGTAFTDFSTADVLTDYIGKRLVIIDSGGKKAIGYIKAAGAGETYSSEMLSNNENWAGGPPPTGWTANDCTLAAIPDAGPGGAGDTCLEMTRTGGSYQRAYQVLTCVVGALYKGSVYVKSGTSGNETFVLYDEHNNKTFVSGTSSASWVQSTGYRVKIAVTTWLSMRKASSTDGTMLFDKPSLRQVLTPSVTGVTIVSTPGGSTYNWESVESGFNYNDASGYTYKISEADAVDSLGIMGHNLGTAGAAVSVESSDDETNWTERLAAFNPTDDTAILKTMTSFQAASKRLKIVTASVAPYLAVAMLGNKLEFNRGAYIGDGAIIPWQFGIVASAQRSKTGNLLGNSIRYKPIDISMTIPTDTYDWFNTYFWPFWRDHGSELKPFFFAPDLTTFTDKIFWMQLTEDSVLVPPMLVKDRVDGYTFIMRGVLEE